jgi:hypothetical protein
MNASTDEQIRRLGQRWARAEQRGDIGVLDALAAPEFRLVGPAGFILDKAQWLERYRAGALLTKSLVWDEVEVRDFGPVAVAIGVHTQQAEYQGRRVDGRFRGTQIFLRDGENWRLAGLHLSPIAPPPPFDNRERTAR